MKPLMSLQTFTQIGQLHYQFLDYYENSLKAFELLVPDSGICYNEALQKPVYKALELALRVAFPLKEYEGSALHYFLTDENWGYDDGEICGGLYLDDELIRKGDFASFYKLLSQELAADHEKNKHIIDCDPAVFPPKQEINFDGLISLFTNQ